MSKSTHFIGQPLYCQLLNFIDKRKIKETSRTGGFDRYVKKLGGFTYNNGAAPTMLPCLQNPTTHYSANNVPTGDYGIISGNPNTWIDRSNIKSIYDPCPYGYRVPIDGSWVGFPSKTWTAGTINEGQSWQSTWWPAAGYRSNNSAAMGNVAYGAYYWSSSPHTSVAYYSYGLHFSYAGGVNPRSSNNRSCGFSLRCVQE